MAQDLENQSLLKKLDNLDQKGYLYRIRGENSYWFGDPRQQVIWQYLTVHHTNIFRDEGVYFLVLIRGLEFAAMVWLTYKDITMKGIQYKFFTVWGAYSTLVFFGLMLIVSLQKMAEHI